MPTYFKPFAPTGPSQIIEVYYCDNERVSEWEISICSYKEGRPQDPSQPGVSTYFRIQVFDNADLDVSTTLVTDGKFWAVTWVTWDGAPGLLDLDSDEAKELGFTTYTYEDRDKVMQYIQVWLSSFSTRPFARSKNARNP